MRILIVNRQKEIHEVFEWQFRELPQVETRLGGFETLPAFDCIATAGNSFGLMDAGLDLAILRFFGSPLQERIQRRILNEYRGEQPVGTSIIVETSHPDHPYVAHTPTMRAPMNIAGTDNVYLASWATLLAAEAHNRDASPTIDLIALPGFGTGSGGVDPIEASFQMRLACEHFLEPATRITPELAQQRLERVHYGGRSGFLQARPPQTS